MADELRHALSRDLALRGSGHEWPLKGLRERPFGNMSGWFLWTGEPFPTEDDAWVPLHVSHAPDRIPHAVSHLLLDAGWRFLVAPGHEDMWFDPALLEPPE